MAILSPRIQIALFAALLFMIIGSTGVYDLTDRFIADPIGQDFTTAAGLPTRLGLIVHAIVTALLMALYLHTFKM